MERNGMEPQSYTIMGNHRFETYGVGSNSVKAHLHVGPISH